MTDYISRLQKKHSNKNPTKTLGYRNFVPILLVVVLGFAAINGFIKTKGLLNSLADSKVDSEAPFISAVNDNLVVFQGEPKRIAVFKHDLNSTVNNIASDKLSHVSRQFSAPVNAYVNFKNESLNNLEQVRNGLDKFTAISTPFRIIMGYDSSMDTNISRIDALKLWWQYKDVRVNDLNYYDLSTKNDEKYDKVLGAKSGIYQRDLSRYLENMKVLSETPEISIVNSSGNREAGIFLENFINAIGGKVNNISGDTTIHDGCVITAINGSYTANYLAKTFGCDIKDALEEADATQIMFVVGRDFASSFVE